MTAGQRRAVMVLSIAGIPLAWIVVGALLLRAAAEATRDRDAARPRVLAAIAVALALVLLVVTRSARAGDRAIAPLARRRAMPAS